MISMIAALAVQEVIQAQISSKVAIKWPNDIYIGNKKMGGILIESDLSGQILSSSIVGIGLNVNQTQFEEKLNATSLKLESGQPHDRAGLIKKIGARFVSLCLELQDDYNAFNRVKQQYTSKLFSLNQIIRVRLTANNQYINITPLDVSHTGKLLAVDEFNKLHSFDLKDLEWQIQ